MQSMTRIAILLVGLWLALMGRGLDASPITGQYANKNTQFGGATYRFEDHAYRVFVFHHAEVEVC